jgi:hypothetical protein
MKTKTLLILGAAAGIGLMLTGCKNRLVFVTHTSYGLDVSGTAELPNKVSFSYNRQETAIVPRKTNGEAHSVFGGVDSDIHWWRGSVLKQTFATGEAAKLATSGPKETLGDTSNRNTASLVFFTATTFGLHLTAGEEQTQANMLMGLRRIEAAYIPVPDPGQEVRSVYADLLINTKSLTNSSGQTNPAIALTTNFPTVSGVRIKQSFATGKAAEYLARTTEAQAKLASAAGISPVALRKIAATERQVNQRARSLPEAKRKQLYEWADMEFPTQSEGKLAQKNDLSHFEGAFLPKLTSDELNQVLVKIEALEQ